MNSNVWIIADTVRTDRKDIFSLWDDDPRHIGTLISGSRTYLQRFERDVSLIRKSPDMRAILEEFVEELNKNALNEERIRQIGETAIKVLEALDVPYAEG